MPDNPEGLPLALLHLRRLRVVFLDRRHPAPRCLPLFPLLRAQNDLQHHARLLQRRLEVMTTTSPILRASSVERRVIVALLAGRHNSSVEKDRDSVEILTLKHVFPAARGLAGATLLFYQSL